MTRLLLTAAIALIAASPSPAPAPSSDAAVVHIRNYAFVPATVTVRAGASVAFVNDDEDAHTVTARDKAFDSGGLGQGDRWTHVFARAGRVEYLCTLHPQMRGTVVVESAP